VGVFILNTVHMYHDTTRASHSYPFGTVFLSKSYHTFLVLHWCYTLFHGCNIINKKCSRQCEIPGPFAPLLRGTQHVKCYSYHACINTFSARDVSTRPK